MAFPSGCSESDSAEAAKKKIIFKNEYAYLKKQVDKLDLEAIDYVIGKIQAYQFCQM